MKTAKRGSNQSADTKFATLKLCDALRMIESGRVFVAVDLIKEAVSMLPDISDEKQISSIVEVKNKRRGFAA